MKNIEDNENKIIRGEDSARDSSPASKHAVAQGYGGSKRRWDYEGYTKKLEEEKNKPDKTRLALATAIIVVFFIGLILICAVFITDAILRTRGSSVGEIFNFSTGDETRNLVDINADPVKKELTTEEIAALCKPCTVSVVATGENGDSIGTGIVVTDDGYIVTNMHVVDKSSSISVVFYGNTQYRATLVGCDAERDIAVLKVDRAELSAVSIGDSASLSDGQSVVIIGTPSDVAYTGSVSRGMVANACVSVPYYNASGSLECTKNLIQLDANINYGNSGSPVFNLYGQVVGIVSTKLPDNYTGVGFAIPMETALPVINKLIKNAKNGTSAQTGYSVKIEALGISVEQVTQQMASVHNIPAGCLVSSVETFAAQLGLTEGDIIVTVNGMDTPDAQSLCNALELSGGCSIRIYRSGSYMSLSAQ